METRLVADVAIDPKSLGVLGAESTLTYSCEQPVELGSAYLVSVGNRQLLGFVTDCFEASEEDLGFEFSGLKPLGTPVVGLGLPPVLIELARFVAEETLCPLPVALSAGAPPGARDRLATAYTLVGEAPEKRKRGHLYLEQEPETPMTPLQKEILRVLRESGGTIFDKTGSRLEGAWLRALKLLQAKDLVRIETRVLPFSERRSETQLFRLAADSEKVEAFLRTEAKRKPAQALTIMQLQATDNGSGALALAEIKALAGVTETTVKALVQQGLLEANEKSTQTAAPAPPPNHFQRIAIDAIVESIEQGEPRPFLLFGVTGSGKTEVYLRAAAEALRKGRQVLYLVPEIALATQVISKLRERFGSGVAVLHSDLSPNERLHNFMRIRDGEAPVVLGARSAVFAPLQRLGLIIVDEEHEGSYKQENAPRYKAKSVALWLSKRHGCPVVFGSATPSVESFYEAEQETLSLLTLPQRAASATLPHVIIDDLAEGYRTGRPAILAEPLVSRMTETLASGNQVILFLNRRSYAPFVLCRDCGHQMSCPHCAVSLSYHRRDGVLRCHQCGYKTKLPDLCPDCRGQRLVPLGVGTEKVEEAVQLQFPEAQIGRLDRDAVRKKGALEETLAKFRCGEIDVLVGTQMVAKGLDFPNVTLVGVVAADISLNFPDFRASERTFQLLSQVAGRAGRGQKPGEVVIQTFNPEHIAVRSAQTHNYLDFYEHLKAERQDAGYPPFNRLINLLLTSENRPKLLGAADELARLLRETPDIEVLGPTDCVLERLKDRWRRHILVKLPPGLDTKNLAQSIVGFRAHGVQLSIDVDPYSLI